jgi:hypothetical protein
MDSASLQNLGVNVLMPFSCNTESVVLPGLPVSPGVYVIILGQPERRRA